jgi:hypothetical protein
VLVLVLLFSPCLCLFLLNLQTWREAWSAEASTTSDTLPFGIVTLAGGTSEGHGDSMGAFRYAQSGNTGGPSFGALPNTFVALAHDAADPCEGGNQCCMNRNDGQGGWPCESGNAPYTAQFMGGIHPRVKKIVGTRLALGARAVAYGDKKIVYSGPVLKSCEVTGGSITLKFDAEQLKDDSIMVLNQAVKAVGLVNEAGHGVKWDANTLALMQQLGGDSPFQIQVNGNFTSGTWLPVAPRPKCDPTGGEKGRACNWNTTTNQVLTNQQINVHSSDLGSGQFGSFS